MLAYTPAIVKLGGDINQVINYVQIAPGNMYQSYLEALASGTGPDLLLLSQDQYLQFANKLYVIPYQYISQSVYQATYVQAANSYLLPQGVGAIPFALDPMVMYWNTSLFTNALIPNPPAYWDTVAALVPKLTVKDASLNITTSAVGLGEYSNIDHAKDILSLLILQTGDPIVQTGGTVPTSALLASNDPSSMTPLAANALSFYTQFADPQNTLYSWNRALSDSQTLFVSNRLAMYFGYASEQDQITQRNPNLTFAVALMPQSRTLVQGQPLKLTYGKLYGLSLAKSSRNAPAAIAMALLFGSKNGSGLWSSLTGLPSDRRDSLNLSANNATQAMFAQSALLMQTWNDPNTVQTEGIFKNMIQDVTSGNQSVTGALQNANSSLAALLPQVQ